MPVTQIAATTGQAFTYLGCMGRGGFGAWEEVFSLPVDVARGAGDTIYVLNWGLESYPCAHVTRCTLDHEWIDNIGEPGNEDGQFLWPGSLALDSQENIYVTDQQIHKVVMFGNDGTFLGKWGTSGSGDGEFNMPSGIAFDAQDNAYVVDTRNNRVQKFTRDGRFLAQWGDGGVAEGQFNLPWGVTVDKQGNVYVADWGNDRVQKFAPEGSYLATFGTPGTGKGQLSRPSDVAVDKDGDVYVVDYGNNRVQVYGPNGEYQVTFVGDATELSPWAKRHIEAHSDIRRARARANLEPERLLWRPVGITVGDDYRILIIESVHSRLQIYVKDIEYADPQFNL